MKAAGSGAAASGVGKTVGRNMTISSTLLFCAEVLRKAAPRIGMSFKKGTPD